DWIGLPVGRPGVGGSLSPSGSRRAEAACGADYWAISGGRKALSAVVRRSALSDWVTRQAPSAAMPVPVAVGSVLWFAIWVALTAIWAVLPSWTPDFIALILLGGYLMATYLLGYYVGSWWALLVPAVGFVGLEAEVVAVGIGGDTGAGLVFWLA